MTVHVYAQPAWSREGLAILQQAVTASGGKVVVSKVPEAFLQNDQYRAHTYEADGVNALLTYSSLIHSAHPLLWRNCPLILSTGAGDGIRIVGGLGPVYVTVEEGERLSFRRHMRELVRFMIHEADLIGLEEVVVGVPLHCLTMDDRVLESGSLGVVDALVEASLRVESPSIPYWYPTYPGRQVVSDRELLAFCM